jgi:hypothetical protein
VRNLTTDLGAFRSAVEIAILIQDVKEKFNITTDEVGDLAREQF